jgi:uncharacterized protein YwgA
VDSTRFRIQKCFDYLEEEVSMSTLADRIRFQKIVYLMQALDVDLSYPFGWYLHGPYSTELADDGFALANMESASRRKLAEPLDIDVKALKKAKSFLDTLEAELPDTESYKKLEIAASLHFLAKQTLAGKADCDVVMRRLLQNKPELNRKQVRSVCTLMSRQGLI